MATTDPTLPVVKNMVLLDSEGKRIAVKYYSQDWYACGFLMAWRGDDGVSPPGRGSRSQHQLRPSRVTASLRPQADGAGAIVLRTFAVGQDEQNKRAPRRCANALVWGLRVKGCNCDCRACRAPQRACTSAARHAALMPARDLRDRRHS
eukprot:363360-Chlamydomonas_euryale.AAC.3